MKKMMFVVCLMMMCSCGEDSSKSKLKEAFGYYNDPTRLAWTVNDRLDELPASGVVRKPLWSGNWLPYSRGGSAVAMDKYDVAVGDRYRNATNWERQMAQRYGGVQWAGHCNGLAAAGVKELEPKRPVVYNGVYFTVDDVKALLTEAWQAAEHIALGLRCNENTIQFDAKGRAVKEECRDMNAGAFHVALANWVGISGESLVIDEEMGYAVWNYPVVSFRVLNRIKISALDAVWWLDGNQSGDYQYNADAKGFEYIQLEVQTTVGQKNYEYILELSSDRRVIGGEWYRSSKNVHPDFLWNPTQAKAENPYLNLNVVNEIARLSR